MAKDESVYTQMIKIWVDDERCIMVKSNWVKYRC